MDVRCEKCLTVYEFDEAQVGPGGVTVKCTQCGNLFKVKRRETAEMAMVSHAARSPAYIPPTGSGPMRVGPPSGPIRTTPVPTPRPVAPPPVAPPPPPPAPEWMVKTVFNGEVFRLFGVKMLRQWIFERKVTRQDLISKEGNVWKPLGGVPELRTLFDEAEAADNAPTVQDLPPGWAPPPAEELPPPPVAAPFAQRDYEHSGPNQMGAVMVDIDPQFESTAPKPKVAAALTPPPAADDLAELDLPPKKSRWPLYLSLFLLLAGGGAGYVAVFRNDLWQRLIRPSGGKGERAYASAREKFLLDSDDSLRMAATLLEQAHGADESNPRVLAALAEVQATWAYYLREDAHAMDARGPAVEVAAKSLRREAQAHLDDAKRYSSDALALDPDSLEANRAMADYLRVDGGPAAEAEKYLARALAKKPDDAESVYVSGALALREGKNDDAKRKLTQANQLSQTERGKPLLRASYLLARLSLQAGATADARTELNEILAANPQHERAHTLLATLSVAVDAGVAHATPDAGAVAVAPPVEATVKSPTTTLPSSGSGSYNALVAQADKLSENGRSDAARKLYEKALAGNPQGVEAMTGIGYCDLDREKFMSAVDRFKQALTVAPDYSEALIGLAESYKVRGDRGQAIDYYRRYLKASPHGGKAAMAQKNIRDLEGPHALTPEPKPEPKAEARPEPDQPRTELPRPPPTSDEQQPPPP